MASISDRTTSIPTPRPEICEARSWVETPGSRASRWSRSGVWTCPTFRIPSWIPPSQMFWAYATTIGFFLAAVAILLRLVVPLAARLLTAEIVGFELFVWFPKLAAGPHDHFNWAANAISVALCGAPWVIADSLTRSAKPASNRARAATDAGISV